MTARDSNNATWYVVRYAEDFTPRSDAATNPFSPWVDSGLHYDDQRGVLELVPVADGEEAGLLAGTAVDVDGQVYLVDAGTSELRVRRCDGSEVPLVCDRGIFLAPAGLALDRRGLLYVADRAAGRVVVVLPDDGRVQAVLGTGTLQEPVDVAVAPDGRVFVADRRAGTIVLYGPRMQPLGSFAPRNSLGEPAAPRPIAVMLEPDGNLLVADAHHPRLLRFDSDLKPLAEVELAPLVRKLRGGEVSLGQLANAYGERLPRFLAGEEPGKPCAGSGPTREGGARLAEVHRALRLLGLRLQRRFARSGVFVSRAFDGGAPGVVWHRVEVEADLPAGTKLFVETVTADQPGCLRLDDLKGPAETPDSNQACRWVAPSGGGGPIPYTADVPDQLVQSPPGRYLRLRVTLESDGEETPSLIAVRVRYPRVSYLDMLPRVYRREAAAGGFLERFLALFEQVVTRVEDRYEEFARELNPDAASPEMINWLACLVDLSFDPSWPVEKRRRLTAEAMDLYRRRGTVAGLERFVEIYTGIRPLILEGFLQRPTQPAFLGTPGSVLGSSFSLTSLRATAIPEEELFRAFAHRFTLVIVLEEDCDAETLLPVVRRIVEVNKPAHAQFVLRVVPADARVGLQSTVGIDFVIGGNAAPRTPLGGCAVPGGPQIRGGVLGVNSILGERRPQYVRPIVPALS
jgi:phage tail-like protein